MQVAYTNSAKDSILRDIGHRLYKMRSERRVFGEGIIDLSRYSLTRAQSFSETRAISKAMRGQRIIVAPEALIEAALAMCWQFGPTWNPSVVVILPVRYAENLAALLLEMYARTHLIGFDAIAGKSRPISALPRLRKPLLPLKGAPRPRRQVLLACRPSFKKPQITLAGLTEAGRLKCAGDPLDWPRPLLRSIKEITSSWTESKGPDGDLRRALLADATLFAHARYTDQWIEALPAPLTLELNV